MALPLKEFSFSNWGKRKNRQRYGLRELFILHFFLIVIIYFWILKPPSEIRLQSWLPLTSWDAMCVSIYYKYFMAWNQKNHIMGNYPQPPNTQTGAEQNFSTIYGNNFILSLVIFTVQKKIILLISLSFSYKIVPLIFGKISMRKWRSPWVYRKLKLSLK